jgi:hypothetical protein
MPKQETPCAGALLAVVVLISSGIHATASVPVLTGSYLKSDALLVPRFFNPSSSNMLDGRMAGLDNTGMVSMGPSHRQSTQRIREVMDAILAPGEPYYDLTNRTARYAYLGRPVPTAWTSPYYLDDETAQRRAARDIGALPVKLLLLKAYNIEHDGGSASLRAYWLYRFVIDNYIPFQVNEFVFAVHRRFVSEPSVAKVLEAGADTDFVILESVFGAGNLRSVPISWGRSYATLAKEFGPESRPLKVSRVSEKVSELNSPKPAKGGFADRKRFETLRLTLNCRAQGQVRMSWVARHGETEVTYFVNFLTETGIALVPLGSRPSWLLADEIAELRLDSMGTGCVITGADLLERVPPKI